MVEYQAHEHTYFQVQYYDHFNYTCNLPKMAKTPVLVKVSTARCIIAHEILVTVI